MMATGNESPINMPDTTATGITAIIPTNHQTIAIAIPYSRNLVSRLLHLHNRDTEPDCSLSRINRCHDTANVVRTPIKTIIERSPATLMADSCGFIHTSGMREIVSSTTGPTMRELANCQ